MHSDALCAVSRPWARALPLSIRRLSPSAATQIFQQLQKERECKGLEGKVTVRGVCLPKLGITAKESTNGQTQNSQSSVQSVPLLHVSRCPSAVPDVPLCCLLPQRTPGSPASSPVWYAMGRGWAWSSSWAPPSPTTATAATRWRETQP